MKTMKRFAARICALFVVLTVSLTALMPAAFAATKAQLPDLPSSQCVVDDANILSSSTKTAIENLNAQLTQQCEGAQIGVLTVDYTGSLSTEDYAVQAANTWGLGSSSKNNGVLILLVMQSQQYADGDYYLATGDGFRNTTLEKQASAIAQTMEDSFAAGDYDAAVTTCANNVASTIADLYGVTLSGTTGTVSNGNTDGYNNGNDYYEAPAASYQSPFLTLLAVVIVVFALTSIFGGIRRGFGGGGFGGGGFGGGVGGSHEELCGAVSGGVLVLSLLHPHTDGEDRAGKVRLYAQAKEFRRRFQEVFGLTRCGELLRARPGVTEKNPAAQRLGVTAHCDNMIVTAVEIVEQMLAEDPAKA